MKRLTCRKIALAFGLLAGMFVPGTNADAAVILFDPLGTADFANVSGNTFDLATIDWGNSTNVAVGAGGLSAIGTSFDNFTHAAASAFVDSGGANVAVIGGNEYTFVSGFSSEVTDFFGAPGLGPNTAIFGLSGDGTTTNGQNYFRVYHDAAPDASNLSGTGFNNGTLILSGKVVAEEASFTALGQVVPELGKNPAGTVGDSIYNDVDTVRGGGFLQEITVGELFFNPNYFQVTGAPGFFTLLTTDGNLRTPFLNAEVSETYFNGVAQIPSDPGGGGVNGVAGNFVLEHDSASEFAQQVVPEPLSMVTWLAFIGLGGSRAALRRRRSRA